MKPTDGSLHAAGWRPVRGRSVLRSTSRWCGGCLQRWTATKMARSLHTPHMHTCLCAHASTHVHAQKHDVREARCTCTHARMHVLVCTHVHVPSTHVQAHMHTPMRMHAQHTQMYAHMHVCTHTRPCTHASTHPCMYVHTCTTRARAPRQRRRYGNCMLPIGLWCCDHVVLVLQQRYWAVGRLPRVLPHAEAIRRA